MEIKEQFDHTFFYFMHLKTRYTFYTLIMIH